MEKQYFELMAEAHRLQKQQCEIMAKASLVCPDMEDERRKACAESYMRSAALYGRLANDYDTMAKESV